MNIQIRLTQPDELAESFVRKELIDLQSSSLRLLSAYYTSIQLEELIRKEAGARFLQKEKIVLASYNDQLIGFGCLVAESFKTRVSSLSGLYVHPNFIRQSIGTSLLDFISKTASDNESFIIYLYSLPTAIKFYEKRGFQVDYQAHEVTPDQVYLPCAVMYKCLMKNDNSEVKEITSETENINFEDLSKRQHSYGFKDTYKDYIIFTSYTSGSAWGEAGWSWMIYNLQGKLLKSSSPNCWEFDFTRYEALFSAQKYIDQTYYPIQNERI